MHSFSNQHFCDSWETYSEKWRSGKDTDQISILEEVTLPDKISVSRAQ